MNDLTATITIPPGVLTVQVSPPALVSQKTVESHLGIPRRTYLESLPLFEANGGEVLRLGRLRLVSPVLVCRGRPSSVLMPGRAGVLRSCLSARHED